MVLLHAIKPTEPICGWIVITITYIHIKHEGNTGAQKCSGWDSALDKIAHLYVYDVVYFQHMKQAPASQASMTLRPH